MSIRTPWRLALLSILLLAAGSAGAQQPSDDEDAESAESKALFQQYYAGKNREVAVAGLELLSREPRNAHLRLIVANSLAWTGHAAEATHQYEMLLGTEYEKDARVALGNAGRWNGHPEQAVAQFKQVLAVDPTNTDAQEGLAYAERDVVPRKMARVGNTADSNGVKTLLTALSHRWRDGSMNQSFEIEAGITRGDNNTQHYEQRELALRYSHAALPLEPQVELSAQTQPGTKVFGTVTLKVLELPLYFTAGYVNWGKMALDPAALLPGLTATRLGMNTSFSNVLGSWRGRYNAYLTSDHNTVQEASAWYAPAWQPFSSPDHKLYLSVEGRSAAHADARYWTPVGGYYTVSGGIEASWTSLVWQNYLTAQAGLPVVGGNTPVWSVGAGAKRWFGRDLSLDTNFWAMGSQRQGAYHAHALNLKLEKLW